MSHENGTTTVTVPRWSLAMFGIAQPIVVGFLFFVSRLLWVMNERVTILTVQMDSALETKSELNAIDERINLLSGRVSRLEGQRGVDGHP